MAWISLAKQKGKCVAPANKISAKVSSLCYEF